MESFFFFQLQLRIAAAKEDYKEAVRLKAAITAATKNDVVGTAVSDLNVSNLSGAIFMFIHSILSEPRITTESYCRRTLL